VKFKVLNSASHKTKVQEDFRLIVDLVLVLAAAAGGGLLAALLRQPILLVDLGVSLPTLHHCFKALP